MRQRIQFCTARDGVRIAFATAGQGPPLVRVNNWFTHLELDWDGPTSEQKREIVKKLTDTMVSIEGDNMRGVTWVVVEEVKSGDWGIGGKPLGTADVRALAAGRQP